MHIYTLRQAQTTATAAKRLSQKSAKRLS